MSEELEQLVADLEEEEVMLAVERRLQAGEDPLVILEQCRDGMSLVGRRFEDGEYYISELIMAGEIFKQVAATVAPHLADGRAAAPKGKVVIGTVKNDVHDIGKDIVVTMLKCANYEVADLGVDVPAERFVEAIRDTGAEIVGLSCMLTVAFDTMKETIDALKRAGLKTRVMIGGGPVSEQVRLQVGADALGRDAREAVAICDRWVKERG